jgi:hypothetical protein
MTSQGWQVKAQDRQTWRMKVREAKVHTGHDDDDMMMMMMVMMIGM